MTPRESALQASLAFHAGRDTEPAEVVSDALVFLTFLEDDES